MLKSANRAATSAIFSSVVLVLSAGTALAIELPKYDKRIEAAAKEIVAKKIGDIRGSVEQDVWVAGQGVDDIMTGPVPAQQAYAKPDVQVAALAASMRSFAMPITNKPVRKISSFIYF
jgi:hypothetical protein